MRSTPLSLAIIALAIGPVLAGPAEQTSAAWVDCQRQPAEIRQHIRYLAVPEWYDAAQRKAFLDSLAFHCNSLSREVDFAIPVMLAGNVARVNLIDYGWDRSTWEKLAAQDPYFHARIDGGGLVIPRVKEVEIPLVPAIPADAIKERVSFDRGQTWVDRYSTDGGRTWKLANEFKAAEKKEEKAVVAHAPWLPAQDITALALATNSDAPIVRADWFIWQTGIQKKRNGAGYYNFLGIKNRADLQKLSALDIEAAKRIRKEIAAIIQESGVALNNRQIIRLQALAGPFWFTLDVDEESGKKNALLNLDGDFVHVAEEIYFPLPNGLFGTAASDAAGALQETVPPDIASDDRSHSNDKAIHPGLSCFRCHEEGLRPIDDWARRTFADRPPPNVKLVSPDYAKLKRLRQLYLSDLPTQLKRDQEDYALAVKKVNGLTTKANAQAYAAVWRTYEQSLTLEQQAQELGADAKVWRTALERYDATIKPSNHVLTSTLLQGGKIKRGHWVEHYALSQTILKGVKP